MLKILDDIDGHAVPYQVENEINIGDLDISVGLEHTFFLENSTTDKICDISDIHTVNENSIFVSPVNEVQPLQQIKCSIKIPAVEIDEDTPINEVKLPPSQDLLKGKLKWHSY